MKVEICQFWPFHTQCFSKSCGEPPCPRSGLWAGWESREWMN